MARKLEDLTGYQYEDGSAVIGYSHKENKKHFWKIRCSKCSKVHTRSTGNTKHSKTGLCKSCLSIIFRIDYSKFVFQDGSRVIRYSHSDGNNAYWLVECVNCGKESTISSSGIKNRKTGFCQPCVDKINAENKIENLIGKVFGRLTVVSMCKKTNNRTYWNCKCECGNSQSVRSDSLKCGAIQSCGCLHREKSRERFSGESHPRWNPSLTHEERKTGRCYNSTEYFNWRFSVFKRDNFTCVKCNEESHGNIQAHHLNSWDTHIEERFSVDNGITLCIDCHKEFHRYFGYGNNTKQQFNQFLSTSS